MVFLFYACACLLGEGASTRTCVGVHVWRSEVKLRYISLDVVHLFPLGRGLSLCLQLTYQERLDRQENSRDPLVSASQHQDLKQMVLYPAFFKVRVRIELGSSGLHSRYFTSSCDGWFRLVSNCGHHPPPKPFHLSKLQCRAHLPRSPHFLLPHSQAFCNQQSPSTL